MGFKDQLFEIKSDIQHVIDDFDKLPVVGLPYMLQVKAEHYSYFVCVCCEIKLDTDQVLEHIRSLPHMLNFLAKQFPPLGIKYESQDLSKNDVLVSFIEELLNFEVKYGRGIIAVCEEDEKHRAISIIKRLSPEYIQELCQNKKTNVPDRRSKMDSTDKYESKDKAFLKKEKEYKNERNHEKRERFSEKPGTSNDVIKISDPTSAQNFAVSSVREKFPSKCSIFIKCPMGKQFFFEILDLFKTCGFIERMENSITKESWRSIFLKFASNSQAQLCMERFQGFCVKPIEGGTLYLRYVNHSKKLVKEKSDFTKHTVCLLNLIDNFKMCDYLKHFLEYGAITGIDILKENNMVLIHYTSLSHPRCALNRFDPDLFKNNSRNLKLIKLEDLSEEWFRMNKQGEITLTMIDEPVDPETASKFSQLSILEKFPSEYSIGVFIPREKQFMIQIIELFSLCGVIERMENYTVINNRMVFFKFVTKHQAQMCVKEYNGFPLHHPEVERLNIHHNVSLMHPKYTKRKKEKRNTVCISPVIKSYQLNEYFINFLSFGPISGIDLLFKSNTVFIHYTDSVDTRKMIKILNNYVFKNTQTKLCVTDIQDYSPKIEDSKERVDNNEIHKRSSKSRFEKEVTSDDTSKRDSYGGTEVKLARVPNNYDESEIAEILGNQARISKIDIIRGKRFAIVEFQTEVNPHHVYREWRAHIDEISSQKPKSKCSLKTIAIQGYPSSYSRSKIWKTFAEFGDIVYKFYNSNSLISYVTYRSADDAYTALITMNDSYLKDTHLIKISFKTVREHTFTPDQNYHDDDNQNRSKGRQHPGPKPPLLQSPINNPGPSGPVFQHQMNNPGPNQPFNGPQMNHPFNGPNHLRNGPNPPYKGPNPPYNGPNPPYNGPNPPFNGPNPPFNGHNQPFNGPNHPFNGPNQPYNGPPMHNPGQNPHFNGRPMENPGQTQPLMNRPDRFSAGPNEFNNDQFQYNLQRQQGDGSIQSMHNKMGPNAPSFQSNNHGPNPENLYNHDLRNTLNKVPQGPSNNSSDFNRQNYNHSSESNTRSHQDHYKSPKKDIGITLKDLNNIVVPPNLIKDDLNRVLQQSNDCKMDYNHGGTSSGSKSTSRDDDKDGEINIFSLINRGFSLHSIEQKLIEASERELNYMCGKLDLWILIV